MLRYLQVKQNKVVPLLVANVALTSGAVVGKSASTEKLLSPASGLGEFLVDCAKSYTGLYAIVNPTDAASTAIASGERCALVPTFVGERYATSETTGLLSNGNPLVVSSGKFVKATGGALHQWVCGGVYREAGNELYIVERVAPATAPATKTLSYDANTGTGTMTDPRSPYFVGDAAIALKSTFTPPTGKKFDSWNTVANGSGTEYMPGEEITVSTTNITLYAQYIDE